MIYRGIAALVLAALMPFFALFSFGQEKKPVAASEAAKKVWQELNAGPHTVLESNHLILVVPKPFESKGKEFANEVEKHLNLASKILGFTSDSPPWEGKLLLLVLPDREKFGSFVRRLEKRSPDRDELASFVVLEGIPHLAATQAKGKEKSLPYLEANLEISGALLQSKAGSKTALPGWVTEGFAKAIHFRVLGPANKTVQIEHKKAKTQVASIQDISVVWNNPDPEKAQVLQASVMEYLAFGPHSAKLPNFLKGFSPDENGNSPSVDQALTAAGLSANNLLGGWKVWVVNPK
ncbi:MAG: hypothetical protein EXR99_10465 [Gemmataceae bacterium]|nr:hypothetical protein [Gemmataceae bacterium]